MWFSKRSIDEVKVSLSRDELLRRSRLLVVDDERPEIVDDLKKARFSVDYESDITRDNMHVLESSYDLILLDYGNVGKSFGSDEGLSLLKYIKRINPSVVGIRGTPYLIPVNLLHSPVTCHNTTATPFLKFRCLIDLIMYNSVN